jgi:hypothetical protein
LGDQFPEPLGKAAVGMAQHVHISGRRLAWIFHGASRLSDRPSMRHATLASW